ncbi:DUF4032 domain-containing protein [Arcanobacterium hippocoleae]|uniref:DUF4032 domain-containing protein n=1 Tax=Arcanobacterium hippocoleae TaxID=149017 RepID=A0ABU1T3B5_9ACTO|nr:DUF4032 domain-containing protein [Arcanobacterium hippocoleae]MDR6939799.1 hypothetical protein [Arcanobacterium hippocoleae]
MKTALEITSAQVEPSLIDLPWDLPLREWPENIIAALPRGISRHVVRFVKLNGQIIAVKEISSEVAHSEYATLRDLNRLDAPCVEPLAVITNRFNSAGEPLNAALITRHLSFSLPYRAVFGHGGMRTDTVNRLIDALTVLMVRLHLLGFFWGDVSLSNTLFRRDASEFAAYLVDAETGEKFEKLSEKKRLYDIDVARTNIIGELFDLQAGGILSEEYDAIEIGNRFEERYCQLWHELTSEESFSIDERWHVDNRVRRLNELGFDVSELVMQKDTDGTQLRIRPKVVDAGHYSRLLMKLTGLDAQEQQARRMINDIQQFQTLRGNSDQPISLIAHEWMSDVYEPTIRAVPRELREKLEPAQIFHEILDHRWYMSEQAGYEIMMPEATQSYINQILASRPDEKALLGRDEIEDADFIDEDWSGYMA